MTQCTPTSAATPEMVVLVHGLAAHRLMMHVLSRRLELVGYETFNWGYPSIRSRIEAHGFRLSQALISLDRSPAVPRFHLVVHSMGSIIARSALLDTPLRKLGRVVMLGPPNLGSPVASHLARLLGTFCPALSQLSDRPESLTNRLPQGLGCEVGIIAASRDRVVPIRNTHMTDQADHIVVDSGHNGLLFRRVVFEHVHRFLRHGRFADGNAFHSGDRSLRGSESRSRAPVRF